MKDIATLINRYFKAPGHLQSTNYWISMDFSSLAAQEFRSTLNNETRGISVEFLMDFYKEFIPKSVGMDLTEVNF